MVSHASNNSAEPPPYGWESSTSGSQDQKEHSVLTNEASPENVERQIKNMPAAITFPHTHQSGEMLKRRRLDHQAGQTTQAQEGFSSDAVKALFNIGQSPVSNFSRLYTNPNPSVWTQPSPTLFGRPEAFHNFAQPLAPALNGNDTQASVIASNQLRATANGFVPSTPTRGCSNGNLDGRFDDGSLGGSPENNGGVLVSGFGSMPPFGFSQIPGLGAGQHSQEPSYRPVSWSNPRHDLSGPVIPSLSGVSLHNPGTASGIAQESVRAGTNGQQDVSKQPDLAHQTKMMETTSPGTPQTKNSDSDASKTLPSNDESNSSPISEEREPAGPPVVWREKQIPRTFKMQRVLHDRRQETFEGAFEILGTMNPDHYQMPNYSKVVCIKHSNLDNILLSIQTGLWTCNANVMKRIMALFDARRSEEEKVLLFWSIPGSKHFCGLTELQGFNKDVETNFSLQENESNKGALIVRWLFCKLIPYDDLRHLEGPDEKDSITQMWNGMHYTDKLGREVVQGYVEAPHVENLLVRPRGDFFRRAMANSRFAPNMRAPPHGNGHSNNGPFRPQQQRQFPGSAPRKASIPPSRVSNGHESVTRARSNTNGSQTNGGTTDSSTSAKKGPADEPTLKLMPVYVHSDGSITPAPHMQSTLKTLDPMESLSSMQRSSMQDSASTTYHSGRSNQSSNQHVASGTYTPFTTSSKFPSLDPMAQRKFSSLDPMAQRKSAMALQGGRERPSQEMAPPVRPFVPQQPASMAEMRFGVNNRSSSSMNRLPANSDAWSNSNRSPSTFDRFQHNIDTWSYNTHHGSGAHTPVRSRVHHSTIALDGSPIGKSASTPRPTQLGKGYGHGSQRMQDSQYLSGQFGTPASSSMSVEKKSPEKATPRPTTTFGHRSRGSDAFSSLEFRTNSWINNLVEDSPSKDQES